MSRRMRDLRTIREKRAIAQWIVQERKEALASLTPIFTALTRAGYNNGRLPVSYADWEDRVLKYVIKKWRVNRGL